MPTNPHDKCPICHERYRTPGWNNSVEVRVEHIKAIYGRGEADYTPKTSGQLKEHTDNMITMRTAIQFTGGKVNPNYQTPKQEEIE